MGMRSRPRGRAPDKAPVPAGLLEVHALLLAGCERTLREPTRSDVIPHRDAKAWRFHGVLRRGRSAGEHVVVVGLDRGVQSETGEDASLKSPSVRAGGRILAVPLPAAPLDATTMATHQHVNIILPA